jgi:hypothetical protein
VTILGSSSAPADVAVQYHCAGGSQLAGDTDLTSLQKVLALQSTTSFESIALARISSLLTNSLRLGDNPYTVSLIEPLLSDALETESLGSFDSASDNSLSFILAVHLEAPRMQLWQSNFTSIFGNSGEKLANQEFSGSRWSWGGSNSLWIIPARDWLLVGCGHDFSALKVEYLDKIKAQGRPVPALKDNWLEADIDSMRLRGWFQLLKPARIRITVAPKDDDLHISARVLEEEAIPWKSDPWQIPKDLVRNRTISFTAGQNVAAFLNVSPAYSQLPGNPMTNQFYFWALDQLPLLNYMAWPVAKASNVLQRLSTEAPAALNPELKRINGTELVWRPEASQLVCLNMNLFVPVLQAEKNDDGEFLLLSSFPLSESEPAPNPILSQIQGRTNLVYYDWEFTGRRLGEWQILSKMITNRSSKQDKEAFYKANVENALLGALAHFAGDTVTEITRVGPDELSIARKAPVGFTAVELVLLADWLCDANSGPIFSPHPAVKKAPAPLPPHR